MTPGKTNVVLANSNVGEEASTTGSSESTKIIIPGEINHQNSDENTIPNKNAGENDNGTGDTMDEKPKEKLKMEVRFFFCNFLIRFKSNLNVKERYLK